MRRVDQDRIALFIPSLEGGGTERTFLNLADGYQKAGFQVDLILKRKTGEHLSQIPLGANLIDLNASRMAGTLPGVMRYLRSYRPRALLAGLDLPNLIAVIAKKTTASPTKIIVSVRNIVSQYEKFFLPSRGLERAFMQFVYPQADEIVAVSREAAIDFAHFAHIPVDRIHVIYNPTITPALLEKARQRVDHPWFENGQPPVILSVGRLEPVKDFPTLVRAFNIVHAKTPVRLMILGEGKARPEIEKLIRELGLERDAILPGFHSNPFAFMKQAAVFALASQHDASPNVLIEAMACNCPVVSTNCPGGPAELVNHGQFGYLVPVGDAPAMAEAILLILDGKSRRPTPEWLSQFTFETAMQKYLELV